VSTAADRRRADGISAALPWHRRGWPLAAVLGGLALAAGSQAGDVHLGVVGRDHAAVVTRTGCVQVAEHGGGCGPVCEYALAADGRVVGWMPCERDGGQAGDRAAVRVDPGGTAAAMLSSDTLPASTAVALGWAGLLGVGLGGVLLCNAICVGPARAARARTALASTARGESGA
jgi:hypothetical protein